MVSNKVIKYMSQYKENNYAPKKRKLEKGDLREHQNRNVPRQAPEAKYSDSNEQSRQIQEEVELYQAPEIIWKPQVLSDAWVVNLSKVEENPKTKLPENDKISVKKHKKARKKDV